MDTLIFVEGPQKGQRYPLEANRLTLGRDRHNEIPIDDAGASRMHAQILRTDLGLRLKDSGSTNGTYLNSRRVAESGLRHGDRITIGDTVMLLECTATTDTPSVLVSDAIHDSRKDITVELDSTVMLSPTAALAEADIRLRQQFVSVFTFMNKISGVLVMDQLLDLAIGQIASNLDADRGAILFLSNSDELQPQAIWPKESKDVVVSRTIADAALQSRQGILSNPDGGDKRLRETAAISARDVGSVMCVPLRSEDRVLGLVYIDRRVTHRPFSEQSLRVLSCMAMQLAITVQNANLYQSLRNAEEFGSSILKSMAAGLMVVDDRDVVIRANEAACRILNIEQKELVGLPMKGEPKFREIAMMVEQTRMSGIPMDRGEVVAQVDGREVPLGVSTSVLEGFTGESTGVITTFRDLTRLKRLSDEVKRSQRLASLGEMAAGIAHEVRNPLNSVHGFGQLLMENAKKRGGPDSAEDVEYAGIILEEVDRINRIVQDLLDFSRQQELTMSSLDLVRLLEGIVKRLQPEAGDLGVTLTLSADAPVRPSVMGNSDKLIQMYLNILRNGMQACASGGSVKVVVEIGKDPNNIYPEAVVSIKDDGCGMGPDELEKIFNPFYTTKDVGTGLGLSICQKIAEKHAGRIQVDSKPGLGTTFRIHIPMRE